MSSNDRFTSGDGRGGRRRDRDDEEEEEQQQSTEDEQTVDPNPTPAEVEQRAEQAREELDLGPDGDFDPTPQVDDATSREDEVGDAAREFEREVREEHTLAPEDVAVRFDEDEQQLRAEYTEAGQERLRNRRRSEARRDVAEDFERFDPLDFDVEKTDDGFDVRLTDEAREEAARRTVDQQLDEVGDLAQSAPDHPSPAEVEDVAAVGAVADFDIEDLEFDATDDGVAIGVTESARRERLREQAAARSDAFGPEDITVEDTADGLQASVADDAMQDYLDEQEAEAETAEFTIPDVVPLVGGEEISGQVRDVEIEETGDGYEFTSGERFGDFDGPTIPESFTFYGPAGPTEIDIPGGGGEFEDVTGAVGEGIVQGTRDLANAGVTEEALAAMRLSTPVPGAGPAPGQGDGPSEGVEFYRGMPEGLGAIGDQALNLPQEAAEFTVHGAGEIASGRGGSFADDVADAAVGKAALVGQQASANPARFSGTLAGSAVASVGAIGAATRFSGPRTGRAVSVAIQPGEELAISAARSGLIPARAATLVPGVRRGHIGAEAGGGGPGLGRLGIADRLRDAAPEVAVEADPEAGLVEVDPELGQGLSEFIQETPGSVRGRVGGARGRAARGASDVTGRVGANIDAMLEAVQAAPGRAASRFEVPAVEFEPDFGSEFIGDTRTRSGRRRTIPEIDTDALLDFDVSFETDVDVDSLLDVDIGLETDSAFLADTGTTRIHPEGVGARGLPEIDVPEVGLGDRARSGAGRAGTALDDFIIDAQVGPPVTGDVALQQAFLRGSDLPYPTPGGARRAGSRRARDLTSRLDATLEDAGAAVDDMILDVQTGPAAGGDITLQQGLVGEGDLPTPSLPRPETGVSDVRSGAARELTSLRFQAGELLDAGTEFVGNVPDATLRIGDAPRTTLFDTEIDLDEPPIRSQIDDPLDLGDDGGGSPADYEVESVEDVADGLDDPLDPSRTGVGYEVEVDDRSAQMLISREVETQPEATQPEVSVETGTEFVDPMQAAEPALTEDLTAGLDAGVDLAEMDFLGEEIQMDSLTQFEAADVRTEIRTDIGQELGQEIGQEVGQEVRADARQELRQEVGAEAGREPLSELRVGLDFEDGGPGPRRRDPLDIVGEEIEYGVISVEEVDAAVEGAGVDDLAADLDVDVGADLDVDMSGLEDFDPFDDF